MRWPLRSYDGGSQAQLTHNDRDKGGNEAHDLEALRIFFFSIFTKGTSFFPLRDSGLGENCFKNKEEVRWHHFSITEHRRC